MKDIPFETAVPFPRNTFESIVQKFRLPPSTPWLFVTDSSHIQGYDLSGNGLSDHCIGKA